MVRVTETAQKPGTMNYIELDPMRSTVSVIVYLEPDAFRRVKQGVISDLLLKLTLRDGTDLTLETRDEPKELGRR